MFAHVSQVFQDLKIPRHMQTADDLTLKRHNVVDVVLDSCLFRDALSLAVNRRDSVKFNPRWSGIQPSRPSFHHPGIDQGSVRLAPCLQVGVDTRFRLCAGAVLGCVDGNLIPIALFCLTVSRRFW